MKMDLKFQMEFGKKMPITRREKLLWILENDPATRNSDNALYVQYWRIFDGCHSLEQIEQATKIHLLIQERKTLKNVKFQSNKEYLMGQALKLAEDFGGEII